MVPLYRMYTLYFDKITFKDIFSSVIQISDSVNIYGFSGPMGQAFGQQQLQQSQQPFGGMGGGPPAAMGQQPTVNPSNPFNMAAAPPQIPQQQQQQQLQG